MRYQYHILSSERRKFSVDLGEGWGHLSADPGEGWGQDQ
ncbi:hypothetical protein QO009_004119 [Brevibacillus aydinogluensis]|nr:hypothetical protein [Brevibacillus aydinogluensis]